MAKKVDWEAVKTKYETGNYSMQKLADEFGFNRDYGFQLASKEGWEKGKTNSFIRKQSAKKALSEVVEDESELRKENLSLVQRIKQGFSGELFSEEPDFNRLKNYKIATEILQNCKSLEWELLQIEDAGGGDRQQTIYEMVELGKMMADKAGEK